MHFLCVEVTLVLYLSLQVGSLLTQCWVHGPQVLCRAPPDLTFDAGVFSTLLKPLHFVLDGKQAEIVHTGVYWSILLHTGCNIWHKTPHFIDEEIEGRKKQLLKVTHNLMDEPRLKPRAADPQPFLALDWASSQRVYRQSQHKSTARGFPPPVFSY